MGGVVKPITWQPAAGVSVSEGGLKFTATGSIKSGLLPLLPLRLYDLAATMRRGPGTRIRFVIVFENEQRVRGQRSPCWQYEETSRPDWFPLSPYRQRYVQGLILPPDTTRVWLEVTMDGAEKPELAPYTVWELFDLEFIERQAVPFGRSAGANQLPEGNIPAGWSVWGQGGDRLAVVDAGPADPAPEGRHFLRVHAGPWMYLAANGVPVQRGTAWRLSLYARGKGSFGVLAHALDGRTPLPYRVGDPQARGFDVNGNTWQRFELLWFAESPHVRYAQVVFTLGATGDMDLDDVQFQCYGR